MIKTIDTGNVKLKRAYEPAETGDGTRVLIDRLWPRGVSKKDAAIDLWLKDLAPGTDLRKWFGHDPNRWAEFQKRYTSEIDKHPEPFAKLCALACKGQVTLVYAAHDEKHNNAVVLRQLLVGH